MSSDKLFGIKEYDYAKLMFGISGYSKFDQMKFSEIKIGLEVIIFSTS